MDLPRKEYPRPQMVREEWMNLNGEWEFEIDFGKSGIERGVQKKERLDSKIIVPFCPESKLSGIGNTDFLNAVWYKKEFVLPDSWKTGKVLLHFEAVDYFSRVWVNGTDVGTHKGGYTPFSFDITGNLKNDNNTIVLYAQDDIRSGKQPAGKQSVLYESKGCHYTRTTGIWQTVWLEHVPDSYIKSYRVTPDIDNNRVFLEVETDGKGILKAKASYLDQLMGEATAKSNGGTLQVCIDLKELHLWQPLAAKLYDLELSFEQDKVCGYFGMRNIEIGEDAILINRKPVFQRLVLDQGFYPDGIYTAPSDEALVKDIELSLALGFNGARLHEKVFERRYLYHADRMGYLVWGEYPNWGFDYTADNALELYLPEWLEAVERDYNSPAVIGWCPFNETWNINGRQQNDEVIRQTYQMTKKADKTRPAIDTSGNFHVATDIYDVHNYNQDPESYRKENEPMITGGDVWDRFSDRQHYEGQPYFVSEYGGIGWGIRGGNDWGYGNSPKTEEEFVERYIGLAKVLLENPKICAACYTQLYDVEQEVNGLYYYDRTPKFSQEIMEQFRREMAQKAAIEK